MGWFEFLNLAEEGKWLNTVRKPTKNDSACTTTRGGVVIYTEWNAKRELGEIRINGQRPVSRETLRSCLKEEVLA